MACGHAQAPSPVPLPQPAPPPPSAVNAPDPAPLPSVSGFVSPYEITRTLRSAGFDPLAPPLREGTTYVARATDYRGILMRVVLDARTGAIRDANRIVPGPGNYGPGNYGGLYAPGYEGMAAYGRVGMVPPLYGQPAEFDDPPPGPDGTMPGAPRPPVAHTAKHSTVTPLPRPRPPELASGNAADTAKPSVSAPIAVPAVVAPLAAPVISPVAAAPKPDVKADPATTATITPPPSASPSAPAKPGKVPPPLPINN
jgi:hypothetical protein